MTIFGILTCKRHWQPLASNDASMPCVTGKSVTSGSASQPIGCCNMLFDKNAASMNYRNSLTIRTANHCLTDIQTSTLA